MDQIEDSKKLNIAMVCDAVTDCVAGSFISTLRFSEILEGRGHKIIFITSKSKKNPSTNFYKGIKAYRFRSFLLPKSEGQLYLSFPTFSEIRKIYQEEKIDVIHVAIPAPNAAVCISVAKSMGIKIVVHSHTQPENLTLHIPILFVQKIINYVFYKYLSWLYGKADAIIYPTKFAQKLMYRLEAHPTSVVISNGVDENKFKKVPVGDFFEKFNIPTNLKYVLYVGRLHPEKSIDTLIKSIPEFIVKNKNVHVLIAGFGHLDTKLMNLAKYLKVENYITFLGRVSDEDLVRAYNACDIFVLPSVAELEGMAVLEAMACGKPVIVANSKESASVHFVEDNGRLFKPGDEKDLAKKILELVSNEELLKTMSELSYKKSKEYDINRSITTLEKLYYSILDSGMKEDYYEEKGIYYRTNNFIKDRKNVVFVHGLSGSSSAWVSYEKKYINKYNILSFDLRGHGKSLKYSKTSDYEIKNFADDLKSLVILLNIDKFVLVSHSYGVFIALEYLKRYGENVKAAIFLSPNYNLKRIVSAFILRIILWPISILNIFPLSKKRGKHIDYSKYRFSGDWNVRRSFADVSNTFLRVYLYCVREVSKANYESFLKNIEIPVLIIHGENDSIFPVKYGRKMHERITGSKLLVISKTDHIIVLNNFPEVSKSIEEFIDSL